MTSLSITKITYIEARNPSVELRRDKAQQAEAYDEDCRRQDFSSHFIYLIISPSEPSPTYTLASLKCDSPKKPYRDLSSSMKTFPHLK
jgi:hypothetical protein